MCSSTEVMAELPRRGPDHAWPRAPLVVSDLDAEVDLRTIGLALPVRALYRNTYHLEA